MVNSVLSTFDDNLIRNPWTRLYRTLVRHLPQLPGLAKLSERPVPRWKSLFTILSEEGVEVEIYRPSGRNLEEKLGHLEERFEQADLIFHDYGFMRRNPSVSQDWLQDTKGNFYFLEGNPSPGLNIFRTLFFGGRNTHGIYLQFAANQIAGALIKYNAPNLIK